MTLIALIFVQPVCYLRRVGHDSRPLFDWIAFGLHSKLAKIKVDSHDTFVLEHVLYPGQAP